MSYRQMATKYTAELDKKMFSYRAKQKEWFGDKAQDCKDGRELHSIKFDFVAGG